MVKFEPPELRGSLESAIDTWGLLEWDLPDELGNPDEWNNDQEGEAVVDLTADSKISVNLPYLETTLEMTCARFIEVMEEFSTAELIENRECRTSKRILERVVAVNDAAFELVYTAIADAETEVDTAPRNALLAQIRAAAQANDQPWEAQHRAELRLEELKRAYAKPTRRFCTLIQNVAGVDVQVSLTTGFTIFGLKAIVAGLSHDADPVFTDYEPFIEIRFASQLSDSVKRNIVGGYLFELATSLGAEFRLEPRHEFEEWDEAEHQPPLEPPRLRPLMIGKGLAELLELYAKAIATSDPEFQLLYSTMVIEYVAQTVVRKQAYEAIRSKLLSANALSPNAVFVAELQVITAKAERITNEDREGIKQTILTCCDATEIAPFAPDFIGEFKSKAFVSDVAAQKAALNKFALSLYSTRNEIAHAKANYVPTGHECPKDVLPQFAQCSLKAAEQVVRWFHTTAEDIRFVS